MRINLFRLTIRLDQRRGDNRDAGLGTGVAASEADLLRVRIRRLVAELRPRRVDQLRHVTLSRRLLCLRGRSSLLLGRRALLSRRRLWRGARGGALLLSRALLRGWRGLLGECIDRDERTAP